MFGGHFCLIFFLGVFSPFLLDADKGQDDVLIVCECELRGSTTKQSDFTNSSVSSTNRMAQNEKVELLAISCSCIDVRTEIISEIEFCLRSIP